MTNIDEALYSRQLYVLGKDAMNSITNSNILISGLNGVGLEIAKCVALAGVKSITLHDTKNISYDDLATNYYSQESDIGKNRVDVIVKQLKELNPYVEIIADKSQNITNLHFKNHQVIVMCGIMPTSAITYNAMARKYMTKFIIANTFGLFGYIFCDFGNNFKVIDKDGENPKSGVLIEIKDESFVSNESHQLSINDKINITSINKNIAGDHTITKIINKTIFKTDRSLNQKSTVLQDVSFNQLKDSTTINFKTIGQVLLNPTYSTIIRSDFERHELLHKFNFALDVFVRHNNRLPKYWNENDAILLIAIIESLYGFISDREKELVKRLTYTVDGSMCPMDSVFGSIAGQEVIKAITGKFIPINQFMYYDALSILPNDISQIMKENNQLKNLNKYTGLEKIIGATILNKIKKSEIFIVGAGAIGCEHLKNFCKIGIGKIHITDMDTIEKSNLNRQFLFRNNDIGKFKSVAAGKAAKQINSDVDVQVYKLRVGSETLSVFSEQFFDKLTAVATALDNVGARIYVDKMCIDTSKPLIDSGTLGAKGNTQVVIPYKSHSYGSTQDPGEQVIPMCTLKHFPYLIEHTIAWAREQFETIFVKPAQDYNKYHSEFTEKTKHKILDNMPPTDLISFVENVLFVENNIAKDQNDCIKFAYNIWHEYFRDQIYHLTKAYPENHKGKDNIPFWSGTKKFPKYSEFDIDNELCFDFVVYTGFLWACICNIKFNIDANDVKKIIKKLKVPKIKPQKGEISEEEKPSKELSVNDSKEICKKLCKVDKNKKIIVLEFDKDNENHISFITATSNSRATNYSIEIADNLKTKGIAGKIIPAIATTTSLVSGLVTLELIKIIQGFDKLDDYECAFVNLATSMFSFSEPIPIRKTKLGNYEFSIWDKQIIKNNPTINDVIKYVHKLLNKKDKLYEVSMISHGFSNLWADNLSSQMKKNKEKSSVRDCLKALDLETIPNPVLLDVYVSNINDPDSDMESISLKIYH